MSYNNEYFEQFRENKIQEWMQEPYNFNRKQAELVYSHAYMELHSIWSDMVNCCDDYADFILDFQKLSDE